MLRVNLSTRPFYNERAVHLVLGALALALAAVTVVQRARGRSRLSARHTEVRASIDADERAADLRQREAVLRASIEQDELEACSPKRGKPTR